MPYINMRTPAGKECKFFFGDYYRGRNREECRLIGNAPPPRNWTPKVCSTCPVPDILAANACQNLVLSPKVNPGIFGLGKRVEISAFCTKTNQAVREPHVGCGQCHPLPPVFLEEIE